MTFDLYGYLFQDDDRSRMERFGAHLLPVTG
jgi:hypothetical protein